MINSKLKYIFLFVLSFIFIQNNFAQYLEVSIDKDTILIGDVFSLEMKVSNLEGSKVFFPNFTDTIGKFEILEPFNEDTLENSISKKWDLSAYTPGAYNVRGFSSLVQKPNGKVDTLENNDLVILYVNTLPVDTSKAFKPLKAPKNIPYPIQEVVKKYALYLAIALLIILLIVAFFWYKKRKENKVEKIKTPLDFHAEALNKLKNIDKQKLWQNDQTKEYYLGISETLRSYLEGRFEVNALESTTDEIIEDFNKTQANKALSLKLKDVLQQCDLAKFAKFKPSPEENTRLMKLSQDFVLHTKPKPIVEEKQAEA